MSDRPPVQVQPSIVRPAIVYFALFGAVAAYFPYISVYYRSIGLGRRGVIGWPPLRDPRRPDLEGMVGRAIDLEAQPDRLDHLAPRFRLVFDATSEKRTAASPQTCSR